MTNLKNMLGKTTSKQLMSIITVVWVMSTAFVLGAKWLKPEIDMMPIYTSVVTVFTVSVLGYGTKAAVENKTKYQDPAGNSVIPEYIASDETNKAAQ